LEGRLGAEVDERMRALDAAWSIAFAPRRQGTEGRRLGALADRRGALGVFGLVALLLIGTATLVVRSLERELIQGAGKRVAEAASAVAEGLDALLTQGDRHLQILARDVARTGTNAAAITEQLLAARHADPLYESLGVADRDGVIIAATNHEDLGVDASGQAWFRAAREGHTVLVQESPAFREVAFSSPIVDASGRFAGAVNAQVNPEALAALFVRRGGLLEKSVSGPIEWLLLDQNDRLIAESGEPAPSTVNLKTLAVPSALRSDSPEPGYVEEVSARRQVVVLTGYARTTWRVGPDKMHWQVLMRMDRRDVLGPLRLVVVRLIVPCGVLILVLTGLLCRAIVQRDRREAVLWRGREGLEGEVRERTGELLAANEALQISDKAQGRALEASRVKTEFFANMSHEIRTPMTAILGYAELLSDRRASQQDRALYLGMIQSNGEYLLTIINDVLDLSKIEAGKMSVERVACSPVELTAEVASLMRARALGKGLTFAVEYRGAIPERIQADPTRVRQILLNVVGNAIKFTEVGGVRLVMGMESDRPANRPRLQFDVIDSGIGMTDEQQSRLFKPFEQADSSMSRRFGGTGLGLAISKRLAEALGGTLTVRSAVGKGSTFVLTLETGSLEGVAFVSPSINGGFVQSKRTKQKLPRLRGRILLVEDAPDNQRLIAFYLRKAGAEVAVAENGKQACDLVRASAVVGNGFDLVLMDMQMPELDGYGATAWLRSMGHRMPVIALTAHSLEGDREKCLAAGCSDFVTKPVDRKAVLLLLRRYLDQEHRVGAGRGEGAPADARRDDDGLASLRERFVSRLHERARSLETHLERGDLDAVAMEAHQLKGTAGAYGFPAITQAAAELGASLRADGTLDGASPLIHRLVALCRRADPGRPGPAP